ncbi:MAG: S9 family peptidase, partial [Bacteroidetes Order II. Incertae sedis bacterium]|nr:S9 family peptidase [Bacteroidetes Order II. bacterium]
MATCLWALPVAGQDKIKQMPGYAQFVEMSPELRTSYVSGAVNAVWADDSESFEYTYDGQRYRFDVKKGDSVEIENPVSSANGRRGRPARGRQFEFADSPDGSMKALYRDHNVWMSKADGSDERQLTSDGSVDERIKYGSASWVYGEELGQSTAMWWSPNGNKLAYYRFDEGPVPDYYLQLNQTALQSTIDTEAYPKAGVPNPVVDLFVYDLESGSHARMDIRDGAPFTDDVVGHYVYNIQWSPDGSELLVNRTNRRQNILEIAACMPDEGTCRKVVRDEW